MVLPERRGGDLHEGDVARTTPGGAPPELVHLANELRIEAEPGVETEAPAVHPAEPDPARSALDDPLGGSHRVTRKAERTWEDAGPSTGQEAERHVDLDTVQHLVVRAVAAEDVDRLDVPGRSRDRGRLACGRGHLRLRSGGQRRLHGSEPVRVDAGRERIDDQ